MFQRAFSVSTREPAALLFAPGGTPPRGYLLHGATLERLCDCVLACRVVSRGHVPLYAIMSVAVVAVVVTSWLWRPPSLCRRRVVATRRRTLVFAMVLTESHYPDLRNQLVACKLGANKQTTTKRKERYGSGYADRDGNPEAPKNRRHGRLTTEEWTRQGRDGLRLGMMHPHTMQG